MADATPRRDNRPARRDEAQTPTPQGIGARLLQIFWSGIERKATKVVDTFVEGPTTPLGDVRKGLRAGIKNGMTAAAMGDPNGVDMILLSDMVASMGQRAIHRHADILAEDAAPARGIGGIVEDLLDIFCPGLLPDPDDPELEGGGA